MDDEVKVRRVDVPPDHLYEEIDKPSNAMAKACSPVFADVDISLIFNAINHFQAAVIIANVPNSQVLEVTERTAECLINSVKKFLEFRSESK